MLEPFHGAERGHGSYRLLAILRWAMVHYVGIQKFTTQSAHGIALYISNRPLVSWLSIFGIRGEADLLGGIELTTAALLAAGAFTPVLSALGALLGIGTFAITWSFFFSTPNVVKWSFSTDPIAWNLTGEFLFKDIALLASVSYCSWPRCQVKSFHYGRHAKPRNTAVLRGPSIPPQSRRRRRRRYDHRTEPDKARAVFQPGRSVPEEAPGPLGQVIAKPSKRCVYTARHRP